jgi:nitroreductase
MNKLNPVHDILEMARWAPSGDNTQPWRFEVVDDTHVTVYGHDTREHCVYDLDGHPSQIAHGAMLETLAIAATIHGLRADIERRSDTPDSHPVYDIVLVPAQIEPDPLLPYVTERRVQRRPLQTTPLSDDEKNALARAVGKAYQIVFFSGRSERWRFARLMFSNARLRLTMPEAYTVHRDIIEWQAQFSEDRVPDQALGLDAMTLKLMRRVMTSWQRVQFFNTWLAGHLTPRLEMDLLPGMLCAAHFAIVVREPPQTIDDYVAAGRAVQRFWLTATQLGLQVQPELTPLIFSRYVREDTAFSALPGAAETARGLSARLKQLLGAHGVSTERVVFMGRTGHGKAALSRSLRLPLNALFKPRPHK